MVNDKEKKPETIRTFVVAFERAADARKGVEALREMDITSEEMMVVADTEAPDFREALPEEPESAAAQGALVGTAVGGVLGLLGGITIVPIVGFGSLLASGLISSFSGVAIGSYLGAIYNARFSGEVELVAKDVLANNGVLLLIEEDALSDDKLAKVEQRLREKGAILAESYEIDVDELEEQREKTAA